MSQGVSEFNGGSVENSGPGQVEFKRLLEKLPAGAYMCDAQGLITYFNQHAAKVWGREPKLHDAIDRYCGSFRLHAADGSPLKHDQCWMALALHSNSGYNGQEIIVERPDGSRLTVLAHANPIHDDSGKLCGAVNVLVDISDRKRVEQALREADRAKDEFLATLAHELRNPLAPLRNAARLLRLHAPADPNCRFSLEVIDRQTEHMTRLIDDLLDLSRITRNRLELRTSRIDITEAVQLAIETSRPLIDAGRHLFELSLPDESIPIEGDLTRLAQAVSNLLNNAAKYTEPGGHIGLRVERQGSDAVVTVSDSGIGIPPDMLPRIFEMFTQVERSVWRSQDGLGIGLSLVRRLIELHGGSIEAHSEGAGKGSRFMVRLPVLIGQSAAGSSTIAPIVTRQPGASSTTPRANSTPAGLRILVVDDNHDSANTLAMLLRFTGHTVDVAYDGLAGIELAEEFRPNVMLMDIGMPKLNGYDTARRIRRKSWSERTVLIALTGWGQEEDRQRSMDAGFDHHMVKPIDPRALMDLLASLRDSVADPVSHHATTPL